MHYILGINAYHGDSAACLVKNGELLAAAEEERFRRQKHWAGLPLQSIRYCLGEAGISLDQVGSIAVNQDANANFWKKLGYVVTHRPDPGMVFDRLKNKHKRTGIEHQLLQAFPDQRFRGKLHAIEHHLAHLCSAFHVSPFTEAVTVSVDGFGDFSSGAWGVGRGNDIDIKGRVYFPHSLGIFYQALTQYLGFPDYGDEYKVMGLAPYGKPEYLNKMRQIVLLQSDGSYRLDLRFFRHHQEKIAYEWTDGVPEFGNLFSSGLIDLLGPARKKDEEISQRHKDIARSVQDMYEEAFFHLLNTLNQTYRLDAVTVAGGCGMNSVANGKIRRRTGFKHVYIQSAAGDAGGAIGAALAVWKKSYKNSTRFVMDHAYWGPSFSNAETGALLDQNARTLRDHKCSVERIDNEDDLCERTAGAIANGNIIGWFQGRMEWGPRALGNRSILGDPRRADMKNILNLKIKHRESFRPFAPSILREKVQEWFEEDFDVPFMMQVFQVREEKRSEVPAVAHVDGSGRLQTVTDTTNPRYHKLISAFNEITGVPMLLNTSFNENEPVVCKPDEALNTFLRTKMDILVLGDWVIRRDR